MPSDSTVDGGKLQDQKTSQPAPTFVLGAVHFAECLRWYDGRLYFSDMYGDRVYGFEPRRSRLEIEASPFHPGGIGWLPDGTLLVATSEDRRVVAASQAGGEPFVDFDQLASGWTNDMLVASDGRLFVGDFGFDLMHDEPRPAHLLTATGPTDASHVGGDLMFANGMVIRSDGCLVVAETFAGRLAVFRREADGGLTAEATIKLPEGISPDGMCIDAEDGIWLASPRAKTLLRVTADGITDRFEVPLMPFSCMLGGDDRKTLFFSSAPDFDPQARRARREGRIDAVRVDVPGVGRDGLGGG